MHTKGQWAGQPFELAPWQRDQVIRPVFGWKRRADGLRRYRIAYIEVPRKNGKSQIAAGVALYLLFCDGEPGAEVYSAAGDRSQAAIVFKVAKEMINASVRLRGRCEPMAREIAVPATGSIYQVLSADVPSKHGLNPHGIIFDELHVQDSRELWDTLKTGRGARRQPLIFATTTAGFDTKSLCGEMHRKAVQQQKGLIRDDQFLSVVYSADEKADWESPATWKRCNPGMGITTSMEYIRGEYEEAKTSPAFENTFRRLHLNQWVQQEVRWIDQKKWREGGGPLEWHEMAEKLKGRSCWAGLDLSSNTDLTALVLVFDSELNPDDDRYPPEADVDRNRQRMHLPDSWEYGDPVRAYDVLPHFWVPEEGIRLRSRRDKVPYDAWRDEGAIFTNSGDAIDQGAIRKKIQELSQDYYLEELAADPYNAHKLLTELEEEDGITVLRMSQGYGSMSAATKEVDTLYRRRQLHHGNHPVLNWCADNVTLDKDAQDNWKPSKKKSRERIDGMTALVMAISRAILSTGKTTDARVETLG